MATTLEWKDGGRLAVMTTKKELTLTDIFDALRAEGIDDTYAAFFDGRPEAEDCDHQAILLDQVSDVSSCPACRRNLDRYRDEAWEAWERDARREWQQSISETLRDIHLECGSLGISALRVQNDLAMAQGGTGEAEAYRHAYSMLFELISEHVRKVGELTRERD